MSKLLLPFVVPKYGSGASLPSTGSFHTNHAHLWRDQGDLVAPIYDWFTEGFDTPVLKEAKVLLEQLAE
jgi:hypothetical protein